MLSLEGGEILSFVPPLSNLTKREQSEPNAFSFYFYSYGYLIMFGYSI